MPRIATKFSDHQILEMELRIKRGEKREQVAHDMGISLPTYYRRLREIRGVIHRHDNTIARVRNTLPLTLERLDREANMLLDELKAMKDDPQQNKLQVMKELIRLITGYRKSLQAAQVYIDARQQSVNISADVSALESIWLRYVDPVFRELGISDSVLETAAERAEARFAEMGGGDGKSD